LKVFHCKEASHGRNRTHRTGDDTASAFSDSATVTHAPSVDHPAGLDHPARIADPRCIVLAGAEVKSGVIKPTATTRLPNGLPAELTQSLISLWTRYAGKAPTDVRTEIRGNVVTCVLVDVVGDFNTNMDAAQAKNVQGAAKLTPEAYKRDAVAAVVRLTRQRVALFVSSHDRDTDVATEVFTLEPSFKRGAPALADRRLVADFRLFPTRVV
jgi:hypothetical protein